MRSKISVSNKYGRNIDFGFELGHSFITLFIASLLAKAYITQIILSVIIFSSLAFASHYWKLFVSKNK